MKVSHKLKIYILSVKFNVETFLYQNIKSICISYAVKANIQVIEKLAVDLDFVGLCWQSDIDSFFFSSSWSIDLPSSDLLLVT